jgi:hypothetical protein
VNIEQLLFSKAFPDWGVPKIQIHFCPDSPPGLWGVALLLLQPRLHLRLPLPAHRHLADRQRRLLRRDHQQPPQDLELDEVPESFYDCKLQLCTIVNYGFGGDGWCSLTQWLISPFTKKKVLKLTLFFFVTKAALAGVFLQL